MEQSDADIAMPLATTDLDALSVNVMPLRTLIPTMRGSGVGNRSRTKTEPKTACARTAKKVATTGEVVKY